MIEVIRDREGLAALKDKWIALEGNPALRIFQTHLWCLTAWDKILSKDSSNRLWVAVWSQDGKDDIVIFPFYVEKGVLRFILDIHNDNNDAVYSTSFINRYWVYRELADAIQKDDEIKAVNLKKMRGESELLNHLSVFLKGSVVSKDNAFAYVRVDAPGDFAASQTHWRSENRKHFRKILKEAGAFDFSILRKRDGIPFPRQEIIDLRDRMIASGDRDFDFVSEDMVDFVSALYDANNCEIPVFRKDGRLVSLEFRLLKGDYSLDWIYLTTDPRTGTSINAKYCAERAKEHSGVIDFGVGAYEYKILTTRPMMGATHALRYGKSIFRQAFLIANAGAHMLVDSVRARRR